MLVKVWMNTVMDNKMKTFRHSKMLLKVLSEKANGVNKLKTKYTVKKSIADLGQE